jgi:hypothetical protein
MAARGLVVAMACLLAACSPYGGGAYACMNDTECGANGKCEPNNTCAFPDATCDSGYRYGQYSQPSDQCVPGSGGDGGVDVPGNPNAFCYGTGIVKACFYTEPTGANTVGGNTTINTDDTSMCMTATNSSAFCVIAATTIDVSAGGTLAAQGTRPLVLIATQEITIAGTLDVSSLAGGPAGAGGDAAGCDAGTAPGTNAGGAGGSFGGIGGDSQGVAGGGTAGAVLTPTALRGGCPGQTGGGAMPGTGGHGGGGVYLIAKTSITVSGTINASGAGGSPGVANTSGGGGGGTGGYIGLECASVTSTGVIVANGGGGAEGSGQTTKGKPGGDPNPATPSTQAGGGAGNSTIGGDGGTGAASVMLGGGASAAMCPGAAGNVCSSGGGGGGGAGIIHTVPNNPLGGQISPPQT